MVKSKGQMKKFLSQYKEHSHRQETLRKSQNVFLFQIWKNPWPSVEKGQASVELGPSKFVTTVSTLWIVSPSGQSMAEGKHALQRLILLTKPKRRFRISSVWIHSNMLP